MLSGTDRRGGPDDAFIEELSRLKRQGASVLVVGSARAAQQVETCRQLLGHATDRPRRRILVSTAGQGHSLGAVLPEQAPEQLTVITHDVQTRSVSASSPVQEQAGVGSPIPTETLVELGVEISNVIETLDDTANGLEPSELRVGIDSLLPLLEEYGRERVFRFVHLTNGRTRAANGMIHYHLPIKRDADIVSVLSPLFDIVVELRERNEVCQERWSLKGETLCSGWIPTSQV